MRTLLLILLISSMADLAFAQDPAPDNDEKQLSLHVGRQSTGSGHMNFTTFGVSYRYGPHAFLAGAIMEDGSKAFRGSKLAYRFFPLTYGASLHPYLQYGSIARWGSPLTPEMESRVHPEGWKGGAKEHYRTFEHYLGFGIQTPQIVGVSIDLGVGMGFYHSQLTSSFDHRIDSPERFRKRTDASLSFRAGLQYAF